MSYAGRSVSAESASGGCIYIRHPVFCFALTNFLKTFQIFLKLFCHMNCQLKRKLCSTLATNFTCIYANWNLLGEREGGRGLSEPERRLMRCGGSARRSVGRRGVRRASPPDAGRRRACTTSAEEALFRLLGASRGKKRAGGAGRDPTASLFARSAPWRLLEGDSSWRSGRGSSVGVLAHKIRAFAPFGRSGTDLFLRRSRSRSKKAGLPRLFRG